MEEKKRKKKQGAVAVEEIRKRMRQKEQKKQQKEFDRAFKKVCHIILELFTHTAVVRCYVYIYR